MYKAMRCCIFVVITFVLLASSLALAHEKGKGRGAKPPGWEKGEKKGWKGHDVPPGIEKKEEGWSPPGLNKEAGAEWKHGRPPGWSRGKKKGWKGADMPPGLAKKQ